MIAPLTIRHTERPLMWFAKSYVLQIINTIPIAAYVYFTPRMISFGYYYPVLILLLALNGFIKTLQFAAGGGFFATVSDPCIGSTYMTFLATLSNLGFALNSSAVLYAANWLPKKYSYIIAVGASTFLGILWISLSYWNLKRLQKLPNHKWHLNKQIITNEVTTSDEHEVSFIPNKDMD